MKKNEVDQDVPFFKDEVYQDVHFFYYSFKNIQLKFNFYALRLIKSILNSIYSLNHFSIKLHCIYLANIGWQPVESNNL